MMGQTMWQGFYGLMGAFGASQVRAYSPKTSLNELIGHTVFGLAAAYITTALGDEKLFNGEIPLSASTPTRLWDQSTIQTVPSNEKQRETINPLH